MKRAVCLFILLISCYYSFAQDQTSSNTELSPYFFLVSPEYDSRSSLSVKLGVVKVQDWVACSPFDLCPDFYQQLYGKYNFTENAAGAQLAFGYGLGLGGRVAADWEYDFDTEKSDLSIIVAAGFDAWGTASIMVGPKFNLTQNNSDQTTTINISIDFAPAFYFQKGNLKNIIKQGKN